MERYKKKLKSSKNHKEGFLRLPYIYGCFKRTTYQHKTVKLRFYTVNFNGSLSKLTAV